MRSGFVVFLPAVVLLVATTSFAQSKKSESDGLMARLSYQSGQMIIDWQYQDWRYQKGYPQICFAVYRSGYYRISRLAEYGQQTLEGTLSKDQLGGLDRVLDKIRFQSQGDGVQLLQGAESLVAEVVRHGETMRYFWINPDHRNPFPKSASQVVDWLEGFQAKDATSFTYHEPSDIRICPSMNENPLPVIISSNTESGGCRGQRP